MNPNRFWQVWKSHGLVNFPYCISVFSDHVNHLRISVKAAGLVVADEICNLRVRVPAVVNHEGDRILEALCSESVSSDPVVQAIKERGWQFWKGVFYFCDTHNDVCCLCLAIVVDAYLTFLVGSQWRIFLRKAQRVLLLSRHYVSYWFHCFLYFLC